MDNDRRCNKLYPPLEQLLLRRGNQSLKVRSTSDCYQNSTQEPPLRKQSLFIAWGQGEGLSGRTEGRGGRVNRCQRSIKEKIYNIYF